MIQLKNRKVVIDIDVGNGGRIAQININALNILVEQNDNIFGWGCYPMAPWVGRLNHGLFDWKGKQYAMPVNFDMHAIHGTCFERSWSIVQQQNHFCELEIDLGNDWPFKGKVLQSFLLNENALKLELKLFALEQSFPACIGWHPWFKKQLEHGKALSLDFEAEQQFECDETLIPTGRLIPVSLPPWDDCFINPLGTAKLIWPDALELEINSSCKHWVVYNKPEHAACVEPQTGAANLVQASIVKPESPLCAQTTFTWQLI